MLVLLALLAYGRIRRLVFRRAASLSGPVSAEAKVFAVLSLVFWTGATVAGRLMAYFP